MKKKKHQGQVIGTGEKIFNVTMIIAVSYTHLTLPTNSRV